MAVSNRPSLTMLWTRVTGMSHFSARSGKYSQSCTRSSSVGSCDAALLPAAVFTRPA
ncbi:hypothetical protein ACFFX0_06275 [Citricoccus parietis]|uniref:Uncharacterized protein n=1 Tax=Citricoccus parietis TaxID=592307 RepID=A0ABV5FVV9_9MICC